MIIGDLQRKRQAGMNRGKAAIAEHAGTTLLATGMSYEGVVAGEIARSVRARLEAKLKAVSVLPWRKGVSMPGIIRLSLGRRSTYWL
ncbi:MAG TPA: hypothetical protein VLH85_08325 [Levilinea sp.]|nr:hypothetical protein [Levilinea sp.]